MQVPHALLRRHVIALDRDRHSPRCQSTVRGVRSPLPKLQIGRVPKWFKGADCKSVICRRFESGRGLFSTDIVPNFGQLCIRVCLCVSTQSGSHVSRTLRPAPNAAAQFRIRTNPSVLSAFRDSVPKPKRNRRNSAQFRGEFAGRRRRFPPGKSPMLVSKSIHRPPSRKINKAGEIENRLSFHHSHSAPPENRFFDSDRKGLRKGTKARPRIGVAESAKVIFL